MYNYWFSSESGVTDADADDDDDNDADNTGRHSTIRTTYRQSAANIAALQALALQ